MGMAAGQARLLSITSRMSDNELRAQLINNDKMRLATKSAQVSEAYTTALNEAQLMFTNYDKDNNSSYKELTFNSLTAYNQYNNQYAISNAAGQLLVSETDAKNFQKSKDITEFLACYGLKQSTTFFSDTLKKSDGVNYWALQGNNAVLTNDISKGVVYNSDSIYTDANGISKTIQIDSGWTADRLKAMYEGGEYTFDDGTKENYAGYMTTKASPDFYEYSTLVQDYNTKKTAYYESIRTKVNDLINKDTFATKDLLDKLSTNPNGDQVKIYAAQLSDIIGFKTPPYADKAPTNTFKSYVNDKDDATKTYYGYLSDQIDKLILGENTYGTSGLKWDKTNKTLTFGTDKDGFTISKTGDTWNGTVSYTKDGETGKATPTVSADGSNLKITYKIGDNNKDEYYYIVPNPEAKHINNGKEVPNYAEEYADANKDSDDKDDTSNNNCFSPDLSVVATKPIDATSLADSLKSIIDNLHQTLAEYINKDKLSDTEEYKAYQNAGKALYKFIYGNEAPSSLSGSVLEKLTDVNAVTNSKGEAQLEGTSFTDAAKKRYETIKQAIVLDYIMDTYGEPKYDWIDEKDKNGNGSAKAQWYENLYNKMKSSGYKALQDGLASSTEWIKFAFESGLVCLEQVDTNKNWHATTYTNCSDITEQTNNAALTKAEAEYNAAMAKIENKDKRYDLELKNIDTEHNSLQTEYDSIKTAIDKNIERTFKIYS